MQRIRVLLATDVMEKYVTLTTNEMQNLSNENKISYGRDQAQLERMVS